jgi:hypothetical protein
MTPEPTESAEPTENSRLIIRDSAIENPDLQQQLYRANRLASEGQYREARELVRVLRSQYPDYTDVLTGLDDAFFEAEAERNRHLYRANHEFSMMPSAGFFGTASAILCLLSLVLFISIVPILRRDGLRGTYTYTTGKVYRRQVTVPVTTPLQWSVILFVGSGILAGVAWFTYQREE